MDWNTSIKGFLSYLMLERGLSSNTLEAYEGDVRKLAQYSSGSQNKTPESISTNDLRSFFGLLNGLGILPSSQARILSAIKIFYQYLVFEKNLTADPAALMEGPRLLRKLPDVLNIIEIQDLIAAIDLSKPEGMRNKAIIEVLYGCGLRVSELVNLKLSDLSLDIEFIKVIGKGDKQRVIPIGTEAIKFLQIYINEYRVHQTLKYGYEDYVFLNRRGAALSRVMVFILIKDLAEKINLNKNISPHTFRHSFASHLVEGGADLRAVQDMLGHESITTTEIYTHLDKSYLKDTIRQFHPRS
ncbi:site-specific tyrosine recombinase XerD [Arcticibacter eurypsychrophilus]|uniref:site-specific tyrosine recombinase XerD n=1 Tax=Arcticibacter eurypsychrophilus TaxID=1434752 RepID=UPI00084D9657|nr:site-specific tyrosine recombinase XerD [Arcticibacter eurypsychrophilus]